MPYMELASPIFDDLYPWAWGRLRSYMLAPDDAFAQERLSAVDATYMIEAAESAAMPRRDEELTAYCQHAAAEIIRSEISEKIFQPNRGWAALRQASEADGRLPIKEWRTVAFILGVIRSVNAHHAQVRGGASLKKAQAAAMAHHVEYGLLANSFYVKGAWSKYRSVAHLCAAVYDPTFTSSNLVGEDQVLLMLGIAHGYQEFMTSFCPYPGRSPLVASGDAWLLPVEISAHLVDADNPTEPLPQSILATIKNYRAPQ